MLQIKVPWTIINTFEDSITISTKNLNITNLYNYQRSTVAYYITKKKSKLVFMAFVLFLNSNLTNNIVEKDPLFTCTYQDRTSR